MNLPDVEALTKITAALLGLGYLLIGGLSLVPATRSRGQELWPSLLSATATIGAVFLSFLVGTWGLAIFFTLLSARVGMEVGQLRFRQKWPAAVVALLVSTAAMAWPVFALVAAGMWLILIARLVTVPNREGGILWGWIELLVFPILPLAVLAAGAIGPETRSLMLIAYILSEVFDSFALVSGKLFGRHKAFPVLSPRKTIEGLVGGALLLMAVTAGVAATFELPVMPAMIVALISGLATVAGDLSASRLKRQAGVKDFPAISSQQGGALDIFDAWIAAGAVLAVGATLLFAT